MSKYLNPRNDLIFKRIFADHPHLLISFLNAIMPLEAGRHIVSLEYLPTELVPETPMKKFSIVDVRCKDNFERTFIIEMQMYWHATFFKRMQFNAQKAYVKQMDKGEDYDLLQPVYTLVLLNENYDEKTNNFYHHFQTINKENTEEVIEGLEYVLVELQKFSSQTWSDRKLAVLWLRFLSEVNENLTDLPEEFTENKDILQAAVICEKAAFSEAELAAYEKYWDTIRLEKTLTSGFYKDGIKAGEKIGIKKGEKIGIEKGKVEGRDERNLEIAKELKKDNMPIELIVKYTGLSAEEINKLK